MIAPEAYRILGETMALGGSVPAGSWPACQQSAPGRAVLLRTLWRIAGSAAISPVPQRPRGQPQHGALSPLPRPRTDRRRVWQGSHALAFIRRKCG